MVKGNFFNLSTKVLKKRVLSDKSTAPFSSLSLYFKNRYCNNQILEN